jgi:hypothetical protein
MDLITKCSILKLQELSILIVDLVKVLKILIITPITQKILSHSSIITTHSSIIIIKTSCMQTQQRTPQTQHHLLAEEEEEIKTQNPNNMEATKEVAMLATLTREGLLVNNLQVDHPQQVIRSNRMLVVVVVVELPDITTRMITLLTNNNIQDSLTSNSSNRLTKRKLTITITLVVPTKTRIDLNSSNKISNKISTRKTGSVNTSRKDNLMEAIMEA